MKNLKRALSFALATVMVIGMMVVGAGAAFTDADKIENADAVDAMVALGVFNGKGDGSYFDPAGTLTRAEAAKIIVYVLHGGKSPVIGTKATPSYTDIKGTWAEAFIEYCSAQGIIAGYEGKFNPTGTLTGTAFAKMLMVAMGYNAEVFGFVGNDWEMNVNIEANKIGLYEDLEDIDPAANLSRDNACLMAYNAVFAGTMEKSYNHNIQTGAVTNGYSFNTAATLYDTKFNGYDYEGVLNGWTYDDEKGEWDYSIGSGSFVTDKDFTDLFGMKVNVLYKVTNDTTVYGVYAKDSKVVLETTVGALPTMAATDADFEISNVEYDVESANNQVQEVPVYAVNERSYYANLYNVKASYENAFTLKLIDNDDDNKIDRAVVVPFAGAKITFNNGVIFNHTNETIDGNSQKEYEKVETFGKTFAKNDIVVATEDNYSVKCDTEYVPATMVSGKVTGVKGTSNTTLLIDGKWYTKADSTLTGSYTASLNDTVELAVVNGYYFWAEKVDSEAKNMAVVLKYGSQDSLTNNYPAMVLFADGTVKTVTIDEDSYGDNIGKLYTFEEDAGVYELTIVDYVNVDADALVGNGKFDATNDNIYMNADATTYRIADDAVVFIAYNGSSSFEKGKVVTGAQLKKYNEDINAAQIFVDSINGFDTAEIIVLTHTATTLPGAGDTSFGYIVSVPYLTKEGTSNYVNFDMWNGSEVVSVKDKVASASIDGTKYAKGFAIEFKNEGNGVVDGVSAILGASAVTGWDGEIIKVKGAVTGEYEVDEDTVIIYIDTDKVVGVAGGSISLAGNASSTQKYANVYFAGKDTEVAKVIFVDVNNNIKDHKI